MMKTNRRAVRGAGPLVATLPNGRTVWLNLEPAPVTVREFDRITETTGYESLGRSQMLGSNRTAAWRLARSLRRETTRLSRMRLRKDRRLLERILARDAKLDRRIDASLIPVIRKTKADRKKRNSRLRKQARHELWNQLVIVSAALLMAAYGQRDDPISENNLVISLSLGVWLFGDEVADRLSGKRTDEQGLIKGLDVWSYTAPFANLLTGWWLLNGRQHERFITGTADIMDFNKFPDGGQSILYAMVDLSPYIAPEHLPKFNEFENVPVAATIQSAEFADAASDRPQPAIYKVAVIMGLLVMVVRVPPSQPELKELRIAWIVDTRKPSD